MNGRRSRPDPRSPVQPAGIGAAPLIVVVLFGLFAIWTLRDAWSGLLPESSPAPITKWKVPDQLPQSARGNLQAVFTPDDYPLFALWNEDQGTAKVRMEVDETGSVSDCAVVESSGSRSLDSATCRILEERARFTPAFDRTGRPVKDTYEQRITWRLEG